MVGAEIFKRYNVPDVVVNAIASHHAEVEPESIEAVIVAAADEFRGRPGARRESLETYVKRVTELEDIGKASQGCQPDLRDPGRPRDPRIVRPDDVDDLARRFN